MDNERDAAERLGTRLIHPDDFETPLQWIQPRLHEATVNAKLREPTPLAANRGLATPSETSKSLVRHSERAECPVETGMNVFMGRIAVDQITSGGILVSDVDTRISTKDRHDLLISALPGASVEMYGGVNVVRWTNQILLSKQVTYLGTPHPLFKKRIQIPEKWKAVHDRARSESLKPRFIGVYHYQGTTIFVDFDPQKYVDRGLNNSAAHVATNDLFQAQTRGQFSREDKNGNRITSIRFDQFHTYIRAGYEEKSPYLAALDRFSRELLDGTRIEWRSAVQAMYEASWPDRNMGEWPGFYLEFRINAFIQRNNLENLMVYQREKKKEAYDFDLRFLDNGVIDHYGDLKASDDAQTEALGNDSAKIRRCLSEFGRLWYVIFEHETWKSKDFGDTATRQWNIYRRDQGHKPRKKGPFDPLSYRTRFKEAVRFDRVKVLEVNPANAHIVLGDFQENWKNSNGQPRNGKKKIEKEEMENFLIHTNSRNLSPTA